MSSYLGGNAFSSIDWSMLLCTGSARDDMNPAMAMGALEFIVIVEVRGWEQADDLGADICTHYTMNPYICFLFYT